MRVRRTLSYALMTDTEVLQWLDSNHGSLHREPHGWCVTFGVRVQANVTHCFIGKGKTPALAIASAEAQAAALDRKPVAE